MTKLELMAEVSRVLQCAPREANVLVEAIYDTILCALRDGKTVDIRGFGRFSTRPDPPPRRRPPANRGLAPAPTTRVPSFRPSQGIRQFRAYPLTAPQERHDLER